MQKISAKFYIMILLLFIGSGVYSQTCPSGNLVLTAQSQVDSFPSLYPNCSRLPGDLELSGDIVNLDSLYQIDTILGGIKSIGSTRLKNFKGLRNLRYFSALTIFNNDSLWNFKGLEKVKKLNYVTISGNPSLRNLRGLDSIKEVISIYLLNNIKLDSITGLGGLNDIWNIFQIIGNGSLKSLIGMQNIVIETLHIVDNDSLWDLEGLEKNISFSRSLSISGNDGLRNLHGVENLNWIPGALQITANSKIKNLKEFLGLRYVGEGLSIAGNASLVSLWGLDSLTKVDYGVAISDNDKLKELNGLENLDTIAVSLGIRKNDSLISVLALSNLTYIGSSLDIFENKQIQNLNGLDNLGRIGDLNIRKNKKLNSLWALRGLTKISGELRIAENDSLSSLRGLDSADLSTANSVFIYDSPSLQVCAVQSVCDYLASGRIAYILNNAPGCNDTSEVILLCQSIGIEEEQIAVEVEIFPNPIQNQLNVTFGESVQFPVSLEIYSNSGQLLFRKSNITESQIILDGLNLSKGVYSLKIGMNHSAPIIKHIIKI